MTLDLGVVGSSTMLGIELTLKKKKSKRTESGKVTQREVLKAGTPWSRNRPQLWYPQPDFDTDVAIDTDSCRPAV